jgi:hypothetical protein
MTKRIADLETQNSEMTKRNAEKVRTMREELVAEYSETIEKLTGEKRALDTKLEEKRATAKETESALQKQVIDLEKERAVQVEKISILESKKMELEEKSKASIDELTAQLKELKESENAGKMSLKLENERLKTLA